MSKVVMEMVDFYFRRTVIMRREMGMERKDTSWISQVTKGKFSRSHL